MLEVCFGPAQTAHNQEVQREERIDESQYSEFVKLFEDTYSKEMYDAHYRKV